MIDLDKRILDGKKPLTAFDEVDSKFIGTDCYFSDKPSDFGDLSNCQIGCLLSRNVITGAFSATKNNSYAVFNYCLPCEWVEEKKEPKYRPFTPDEFTDTLDIGESIIFRRKQSKHLYEYHVLFIGVVLVNNNTDVILGNDRFSLETLFNNYEWRQHDSYEWQTFGVLEV